MPRYVRRSTRRRFTRRRPTRRSRFRKKSFRKRSYIKPMITKQRVVKMRYVDNIVINPVTGATGAHVFRAASIWDPDLTATGHRPSGYANMNNQYNHYTVIGSKISATFFSSPNATGDAQVGICGIFLGDSSTSYSDNRVMMENAAGKWKYLSSDNGSRSVVRVNHGFSPKKHFGMKSLVGDTRFTSLMGTNPTEEMYYIVWLGPLNTATDIVATNVSVTIQYLVVFTERKTLGLS